VVVPRSFMARSRSLDKAPDILDAPDCHVWRELYGLGKAAIAHPLPPAGLFDGYQRWNRRFGAWIADDLGKAQETNFGELAHVIHPRPVRNVGILVQP